METQIWVNIASGNGLLPVGTKPLAKPLLTYHQCVETPNLTRFIKFLACVTLKFDMILKNEYVVSP